MIRLTIPSIDKEDLEAVADVLATGYLVQGERVAEFEKSVADYVGTTFAVAVSNCTAALHLGLLAIDVRPGDMVLVTSYSWIATANVIELCGARPVFVDICPDSFTMDPQCLKRELNRLIDIEHEAKRVKAIMPVHTFGLMADMPKIMDLAGQYNIPVIEDAACALGATLNGRKTGTWGVMGCFSFHPRKAITTGEGGIVTTNDSALANRIRALRNHGQEPDTPLPEFTMPGFNYRMTEFQAALGLTQMKKLDRIIHARRRLASTYSELLADTSMQLPEALNDTQHVYQSYVVVLSELLAHERQGIIGYLKQHGIETTIGTWHLPLGTYFQTRYGYKAGDFPVTDRIFAGSLTLPLYENLTGSDQAHVIDQLLMAIDCACQSSRQAPID